MHVQIGDYQPSVHQVGSNGTSEPGQSKSMHPFPCVTCLCTSKADCGEKQKKIELLQKFLKSL